jgi:branched-chain amino acid transport system substrate-binding protein
MLTKNRLNNWEKEESIMKAIVICLLSILLVVSLILGGCAAPAPTPKPSPAPAPAAKPPIKIGHIRSLTGPTAITNAAMVKGFDIAMELAKYEVAGRKIEVILEDDAIKPELAIDKARKLVEQDKVDLIVGPTLAPLQIAVATFMNKAGIPNVNTNTSPYAIVAQKLAWTIQVGGTNQQVPSCAGKYVFEKLGLKKLTIIGEDSGAGRDYVGNFVAGFKKSGGEIVHEQWVPQNTADYAPYFAAAKISDGVLAWTSGNDSVKFLNQYYDFGMWDKMPLVPAYQGAIIESFILAQLSPKAAEACLGMTTAMNYTPLFDNPVNKIFVDAYKAKYNVNPDTAIASAYNAVLVILDAIKATGGDTTPQKLMDAMLASSVPVLDGSAKFDKAKKTAIKDIAISKLQKLDKEFLFSAPIFTFKDVPPEGL